jgi:hypothetical protein
VTIPGNRVLGVFRNDFAVRALAASEAARRSSATGTLAPRGSRPTIPRCLVPKARARRVAHHARGIIGEVDMIAHACSMREARALRRHHVRIVGEGGRSVAMDRLWRRPPVKAWDDGADGAAVEAAIRVASAAP